VVKLSETEKEGNEFEKEMLEQILKTTASKSLIYLQFFIGRVIKVESLSIHWTAQQLRIRKDHIISRIELREKNELVGSIYLVFPYEIAHRLTKDMYGELIPEIYKKHVLDMVEEMTNIISAPLSETTTFFSRNTPVIPSVAQIVSYDEFKSLPVEEALVLELKMGSKMKWDKMKGDIYFVMEGGTVKRLKRTLKRRERE
jgi:chemotaxis protein CheY-P-specific phosphatase CheC